MSQVFDFGDLSEEEIRKLDKEAHDKYFYNKNVAYYRRNREAALEAMRDWYRRNKERKAAYDREHREEREALRRKRHAMGRKEDPQIVQLRANLRKTSKRPSGHRGRVTRNTLVGILKEEIAGRVRNYQEKDNMEKKKILCIVGESGTGKTLASLHLKNKLGANVICSYTTRPPRKTEVEGRDHHFIDIVPPKDELLAYAEFGMYRYYATKAQVYGPVTVYVIDEQGIRDLIERHGDRYEIYSVYIMRDKKLRRNRGITESRMNRDKWRKTLDLSFYNYKIENNGTKRELFNDIERIYNEVKEK